MGKIINLQDVLNNNSYNQQDPPQELIEALKEIGLDAGRGFDFFWKELPEEMEYNPNNDNVLEWKACDFKDVVESLQRLFPYDPDYSWDYLYSCIQMRANEIENQDDLREPITEQDIIVEEFKKQLGVDIEFAVVEKWLVGFAITKK